MQRKATKNLTVELHMKLRKTIQSNFAHAPNLGLLGWAELGCLNPLRGRRERDAHAVLKQGWPVLLRHAVVHQWAVPVPLDVPLQILLRVAPRNPVSPLQTIEGCNCLHSIIIALKVHESILQGNETLQIDRDVEEVVQASKASILKDLADPILHAACGQVLKNEHCAAIMFRCERLNAGV